MITSSCQKLCYGNWELLQVLVIPWTGLWWAKWSWNSCLLLSFFDTQGQPVILLSIVLGVHSYLQCIQKKRSWQTSVWTKWSFLCHCLYTFFLCVNVCIQKMNVFKNDNWPEDYSLCLYLSMSASLLTECCESEKGLRFGEMASASWILMISLKDFLYKILYC